MNIHGKKLRIGLLTSLVLGAMLAIALYSPVHGATSIVLMNTYGPGTSTVPAGHSTDDEYNAQQVVFNYSGDTVLLSSCPDQACTWAIDDAIRVDVTHPDGSTAYQMFTSNTHDIPAVDVTHLFEVGNNTIDVVLVDLMGPSYSLPRNLYLIEYDGSLPEPELAIQSIPDGMNYGPMCSVTGPMCGLSKDPVNTATGAFVYTYSDISIAGRGPTPSFIRNYSSLDTRVGNLGPSWTHNYSMYLVHPNAQSNDVVVVRSHGGSDLFTRNQDGSYSPPLGVVDSLDKNTDGTYTLTGKNLASWVFSEAGLLLRIVDRYGNHSTLSYDAGQLTSVSDPAGRGSLTFVYNANGLLTSVTDWANRTISFTYDTNDRLETVTDREGETTTYAYDGSSSRLTTITDARGNVVVTNTYDTEGRVATQKDAFGLTTGEQTTFSYVTNPDGTKTTTVTYPATSYDPNWDFVEVDTYNVEGLLSSRVSKPTADSSEWITVTYGFDSNGLSNSTTDGRGHTTEFCYDVDYSGSLISGSYGNLTRVIGPPPESGADRPVTLSAYDDSNNLIQEITPKGVASSPTVACSTDLSNSIDLTFATDYVYDTSDVRLESMSKYYADPQAGVITATTKFFYEDLSNPGSVTKVIPPRGNVGSIPDESFATSYEYENAGMQAGMLITVTEPLSRTTSNGYDSVGRLTSTVGPKGNLPGATPADHTWEYQYDNENRVTTTTVPAPAPGGNQIITVYQYDEVGNKVAEIDPNGQVKVFVYDARDSLQEVHQSPDTWTDPLLPPSNVIVAAYEYDHFGNLKRVIRAKDDTSYERVTDYTYDGLDRLREEIQYPEWPTTTTTLTTRFTYDNASNQLTMTDPLGQVKTFDYDALNRLVSIDYSASGTSDVSYSYDANGNRLSMVDGIGTSNYTYDEWDRLLSVTDAGNNEIEYAYDTHSNRVTLVYPDDTEVDYVFDEADRLTTVTDWSNRTTTYEYFIDDQVKQQNNDSRNGTSTHYTYDNAGRLTQVWNKYEDDTYTRHTYSLDAAGYVTHTDEVLNDGYYAGPITPDREGTIDYTYDGMYRLTSEHRDLPSPQDEEIIDFTYDPVGNRLSQTTTDPPFNPDSIYYIYDRADRIEEYYDDEDEEFVVDANGNIIFRGSRGDDPLEYDQENRLTYTDDYRGANYFYDGDGKRVLIIEDRWWTVVNRYVYDVNNSLPQLLQDMDNKYVYGLGLIYVVDDNDGPGFYHKDRLGSIRAITDDRYPDEPRLQMYEEYNAFGEEGYSNRTYDQPFKFTGEQYDDDPYVRTDYTYLRTRYLDHELGRFLTRDTYPGDLENPLSLNRYTYVENNPVNYTDPSGHASNKVLMMSVENCISGITEMQLSEEKAYYDSLSTPLFVNTIRGYGAMLFQAIPRVPGQEYGFGHSEKVRKQIHDMGYNCITYGGENLDTSSYGNIVWGYQMKRLGIPQSFALTIGDWDALIAYGKSDEPDDKLQIKAGYQQE